MNCLYIGSFYYFCYLYLVLNFMLAVCESWCGNFSGHLSSTCRFSWELIYNLINKRNIFVNYEHIISFLKKSILPFSFFVNSKHAIKVVQILVQRHIWLQCKQSNIITHIKVIPYWNFSIVCISIVTLIVCIFHITMQI